MKTENPDIYTYQSNMNNNLDSSTEDYSSLISENLTDKSKVYKLFKDLMLFIYSTIN